MFLLLTSYTLLPIQRVESLASSSWFGGLILLILIAFVLSVSAHRKQYTLYVRNLLNRQGRVMNYEQESMSAWANVLLWFVVISGFALLVTALMPTLNFFIMLGCIALYFVFKWLLIRFIGYVFGLREVSKAFSTDYFVIIALLGLVLVPVAYGMIYMPRVSDISWMIMLSIIGGIVFVTLFIKLLQIFYAGIGSLFYIFLYLCTSEILPLFVAVKMAQMW